MKWSYLFMYVIFFFISSAISAQSYPGKFWKQYAVPEQAGFSSEKLEALVDVLEEKGTSAFLIIQDGKIVLNWGATNQRFRQASIRKSYLNALYGIYSQKQGWNLNESLSNLQIDDLNPLTNVEKEARVIDLLAARSGVYHPSAYNTRSNAENLPDRGSHLPGTFWYYNNWDFNVLLTIFEQKSEQVFFEVYERHIAKPLQMEDFRLFDTYYRYEPEVSKHAAYLFKMTARDMARFGWLFLNDGKWKNKQIVPKEWIAKSVEPITEDLGPQFDDRGGYGLLWWISDGIEGHPMYYASGAGGQRICIFPEDQLVMVHLTDTYQNRNIWESTIDQLLALGLQAKIAPATKEAKLILPSYPKIDYPKNKVPDEFFATIEGTYQHPFLGTFKISRDKKMLVMTAGIGRFQLFFEDKNRFIIGDMMLPLRFEKGGVNQSGRIETPMREDKRTIQEVIFYY